MHPERWNVNCKCVRAGPLCVSAYLQIIPHGHICPPVICVHLWVYSAFLPCAALPGRAASARHNVWCYRGGGRSEFQSPPLNSRFLQRVHDAQDLLVFTARSGHHPPPRGEMSPHHTGQVESRSVLPDINNSRKMKKKNKRRRRSERLLNWKACFRNSN